MHKPENIRGYPDLCIRRGSVERRVEQMKEAACAMNTTDAYRPQKAFSVGQQYDEEYSLDWSYLKATPTHGEKYGRG
jgi:hypothetical protein